MASNGLKVKPPSLFTGAASELPDYLRSVQLYIHLRPDEFPDETTKVLWALSYVAGAAGLWADLQSEEILQSPTSPYPTMEHFIWDLKQTFGDPMEAETSQYKMESLRQDSTPFPLFLAEFRCLAYKTGHNESTHIMYFRRALCPNLMEQILTWENLPDSLEGWYAAGLKAHARQVNREHRDQFWMEQPSELDPDPPLPEWELSEPVPHREPEAHTHLQLVESLISILGHLITLGPAIQTPGHQVVEDDKDFKTVPSKRGRRAAPPEPMRHSVDTRNRFAVLGPEEDDGEPEANPDLLDSLPPRPAAPPERPAAAQEPMKIVIRTSGLANQVNIDVALNFPNHPPLPKVQCLVDSRATAEFIDTNLVKDLKLPTKRLPRPIAVYNVDGTPNQAGHITEQIDVGMTFGKHKEKLTLLVTDLGRDMVILGHQWLQLHNLEIDWKAHKVEMTRCPPACCHPAEPAQPQPAPRPAAPRPTAEAPPTAPPQPTPPAAQPETRPAPLEAKGRRGTPVATPKVAGARRKTLPRLSKGKQARRTHIRLSAFVEECQEDDGEEESNVQAEMFANRSECPDPEPVQSGLPHWAADQVDVKEGDRLFVRFIPPAPEFEPWSAHKIRATGNPATRLAAEAAKDKPELSFRDVVPPEYHDFEEVFAKEAFDKLPDHRPWDHAIELKTDELPRMIPKVYPMTLPEQAELDRDLAEHLASGRIRPSKSPMASPIFYVKKKDGALRLVQDYRKLNELTIKNRYPLPLMADIINKLRNAQYFTKLDVRWGYNNIRIKEGDEWKAAFRTNRGLFEPLVMFFGLTNSPATFQTMMNEIFRDLIDEGVVIVYMDDILIFTHSREEHKEVTRRVLEILRQHKLYLKPEKCQFEREEIEYLGLIISGRGVSMDPVKVQGVTDWPTPKKVKEVQSFLGFVNFYRRFIEGFSHMSRPLHDLTAKGTPWKWACQDTPSLRGPAGRGAGVDWEMVEEPKYISTMTTNTTDLGDGGRT